MKKIFYLFVMFAGMALTACSDDEWGNDNAEMEHVYYFGFQNWGEASSSTFGKNNLVYPVSRGETVQIPMQFWCEFVRSYDVETYYYVTSSELTRGTDYEVVDENGAVVTPGTGGAYSLIWENARKGVKNICIKALNGKTGKITVQTADPDKDKPDNQKIETTIQHTESQYEVRIFTQNYKVTVEIQ